MIRFSCPCGRQLQAPEANAGQKAKCPICGEISVIPSEDEARPNRPAFDSPPAREEREGGGYSVRDEEPAGRYDRPARRDDEPGRYDRPARRDDWDEDDQPNRRRSRFARGPSGMCQEAQTSMITGVIGLFCCEILSVVAIITGVIALNKISASGGELDGKGQAIAGIVMGSMRLVGTVLYLMAVGFS